MFTEVEILEEFVDQTKYSFTKEDRCYRPLLSGFDAQALYVERIRLMWRKAQAKYRAKQPIVRLRKINAAHQRKWISNPTNKAKKNARMRMYMREYNARPEIIKRNALNRERRLAYLKAYRERVKNAKQRT